MSWFRRTPLDSARWVVIDCETSGLDPARDRLLSVGAVEVRGERIELATALEVRVRQDTPSAPENIVIHGIGADAQRAGLPLPEVVSGLAAYVGDGFPVGFHAGFDAEVLRRHGVGLRAKWLDLAALMPALFPRRKAKALDEWLAEFAIASRARHQARGDALASAQLLLVALSEARRQGVRGVEGLLRVARSARLLG